MEAFILIGDGFDEPSVIDCLCQVRDQGLSVNLVGLYAGILSGCHGVAIHPDLSLSQLEYHLQNSILQTALIVSGRSNPNTLLTDPRVHQLVEQTLNRTGLVAIMSSGSEWQLYTNNVTLSAQINLLIQDYMETAHFIAEIIKRIQPSTA